MNKYPANTHLTLVLKQRECSTSIDGILQIIYIYIYIIAEAERKWIPTIKEVLTNKITAYLKFRHVSLKKVIHYIVWRGEYRLTVVGYIKKKKTVFLKKKKKKKKTT